MAIEETKEQQQMYSMFRLALYMVLAFELIMNIPIESESVIFRFIVKILSRFAIFNNLAYSKITELILIILIAIGTKAKKELKFNWKTMVIIPCSVGVVSIILAFSFHKGLWGGEIMGIRFNRLMYALFSIIGVMTLLHGLDSISKYMSHRLVDDRFNFENESFEQSEKLVENQYSVNIPK